MAHVGASQSTSRLLRRGSGGLVSWQHTGLLHDAAVHEADREKMHRLCDLARKITLDRRTLQGPTQQREELEQSLGQLFAVEQRSQSGINT